MEERFVVFDVNVLIPLLIPASRSSLLLAQLTSRGYRVATTPALLADVERKLRTKHSLRKWLGVDDERIAWFMTELQDICDLFSGTIETHGVVQADPDDDRVIAAAVESGAEFVVSEDRHLLDLNPWCNIRIVTRDEMLNHLKSLP